MCSSAHAKCLCSVRRVSQEAAHSPLLFLSGWMHRFAPLAWHWEFGGDSLPAAPLRLLLPMLPELQHVRWTIPPKPHLGTAPARNHPVSGLLPILARRGKLSPCWTGAFSSHRSDLHTQEICVAELLYGTSVKHALTVCKCVVFKQRSLYYQMQSCRLCSSG